MKVMAISFVFIFFLALLSASVIAISITEVELNPAGTDSGNEWVELYSSGEYNLSGHFLENNDGDVYNLSGSFSGYYTVTFNTQWLDNTNESVKLKSSTSLIDETDILEDNDNNAKAWSKCDDDWQFIDSTKNTSNSCPESQQNQSSSSNQTNQTTQQNSTNQSSTNQSTTSNLSTSINATAGENESSDEETSSQLSQSASTSSGSVSYEAVEEDGKIVLSAKKTSKELNETKSSSFIATDQTTMLIISYAFLAVCIFIIILLAWKKL